MYYVLHPHIPLLLFSMYSMKDELNSIIIIIIIIIVYVNKMKL